MLAVRKFVDALIEPLNKKLSGWVTDDIRDILAHEFELLAFCGGTFQKVALNTLV